MMDQSVVSDNPPLGKVLESRTDNSRTQVNGSLSLEQS